MRRAVSSAYYSLFHLLIRDTIAHWSNPAHYPRLVRTLEHRSMKAASASMLNRLATERGNFIPAELAVRDKLRLVAQGLVDLQQARHKADYDTEEPLDAADALLRVEQAIDAFYTWQEIKDASISQDYLYSLLFRDRSF